MTAEETAKVTAQETDAAPRHRVELWTWLLDAPEADIAARRALLSPEEAARAARFVQPRHRDRYASGRGRLREILGSYLACDPAAVDIRTDSFNKPFVPTPQSGKPVHFNLSHSQGFAVLAVSRAFPLGVDVEQIRPIREAVERLFSPAEQAALAPLWGDAWLRGFYQCWTRKEAFVKALGRGLLMPLADFDVTLAPGEAARLLRFNGEPDAPECWALHHLEFDAGLIGALATPTGGTPVAIVQRQ